MESRRCCGSRNEIVWVDGFRLGSTATRAFFQSAYTVESFFYQNALSAASPENVGMGLRRLFMNHALLPAHVSGRYYRDELSDAYQCKRIEDGVRESTQSWREVLLKLKSRGMNAPQ